MAMASGTGVFAAYGKLSLTTLLPLNNYLLVGPLAITSAPLLANYESA